MYEIFFVDYKLLYWDIQRIIRFFGLHLLIFIDSVIAVSSAISSIPIRWYRKIFIARYWFHFVLYQRFWSFIWLNHHISTICEQFDLQSGLNDVWVHWQVHLTLWSLCLYSGFPSVWLQVYIHTFLPSSLTFSRFSPENSLARLLIVIFLLVRTWGQCFLIYSYAAYSWFSRAL